MDDATGGTSTPARRRVLRALAALAAPATVEEVAERVGATTATVRKHLDDLVLADLVRSSPVRSGRPGRPRLRYWAAAPAPPAEAYQRLSGLLAEVVAAGDAPEVVGRRLGAGRARDGRPAREALVEAMALEGFLPELADGPEGAVMTFHHCPYASVALDHPGIVCALHRGMADGILAAGGGGAAGELEVRDPRVAGCRLHLLDPPA